MNIAAGMPLKPIHFLQNKNYFHLTLTYQVSLLIKELDWIFIQKILAQNSQTYEVEIQALVLMDTHLHLIVSNTTLSEHFFTEAMQVALGGVSADSHVCEKIDNLSQYLNTYKYVYRNPVEALMCGRVEDYRYSSLHSILGKSQMSLPVYDQLGVIQNPFHVLKWLNFEDSYKSSKMSWLVDL